MGLHDTSLTTGFSDFHIISSVINSTTLSPAIVTGSLKSEKELRVGLKEQNKEGQS